MESLKDKKVQLTLGTGILVLITIVTFAININTRFERIEFSDREMKAANKVVEEQGLRNKAHINGLETQQAQADIDRAKILTKLESIEVSILELKQELKDHDLN